MSRGDAYDEGWEDEGSASQITAILLDPIGVVRRRWMAMAGCAVLGVLATAVALMSWEPSYRGSATVLITSQQIPDDFVRSTVREDSIANINAMIGKVMSAENLSRVIDELGLFPDSADAPRMDLVGSMRSSIQAAPQARPGRGAASMVYEIAYQSDDAQEAAKVANALAVLFVEESIARRNTQARRTTEFLRQELERDEKELREHASTLSEFRRAHRGELPEELPTALRKIDTLTARVDSLTAQISLKEDRILSISTHGGDSVLTENEIVLAELRRQLAHEIAAHTDEHPNVIALRERIARLAEVVDTGAGPSAGSSRIIDMERRDIGRLQGERARAQAEIESLDARVDRTPAVGEELSALMQKEQVLREDYLDAMRKVEEAELAESLESAQQGGQVTLLDAASPPSSPEQSRSLVGAAGLGGTVAFVLAIAFLLELVDPVVLGTRQIEQASPSPVLGSLPFLS